MLYQPSYPQPYFSDIDALITSRFSCYINADSNTQVSAYRLKVDNLGGNEVYNSGRTTLSTPLYGNELLEMALPPNQLSNGEDYTWRVSLYGDTADIWVASGIMTKFASTSTSFSTTILYLRLSPLIEVGMTVQTNNQQRQITSIDSSEEDFLTIRLNSPITVNINSPSYTVYDNKVQSLDYYFKARTTPVLTINTVPNQIQSKSYTFSAVYSQAENVNYKYFEWYIYDSVGNVINESGQINVGEITYTFDGFLNNSTYGVGLTLENQDGVILNVSPIYFNVSYDLPSFENNPIGEVECDKDAIKLTWNPLLINNGVVENTQSAQTPWYEYIRNAPYSGASSVYLHKETLLSWTIGSELAPIQIPYESTSYFYWHSPNPDFSGVIYEQIGEYVELLTFSTVAPAIATKGDRYYNLKDNKIYTAIDTDIWGTNGEIPNDNSIYYLLSNNMKYIWNGSDMVNTDFNLPSYTISYDTGVFTYTILNGDINITGEVKVSDIPKDWLLQPDDASKTTSYIWQTDTWDDTEYWTETTQSVLDKGWFKITLLPTEIQVTTLAPSVATTLNWNGDIAGKTPIMTNMYKVADSYRSIRISNACVDNDGSESCSSAGGVGKYFTFTYLSYRQDGVSIDYGQKWNIQRIGQIVNIYRATPDFEPGLYFQKTSSKYISSCTFVL